jgi:hypothetical protein
VAITVVQTVAISSSYSGNFASAVTTGNSIVMAVTGRNVGNTITTSSPQYNGASVTGASKLIEQQDTGSNGATYVSIWLLPNVASSGTSLSITTNSTPASFVGIMAYEVAGLGSNPTLDKSNSNTGAGTTDQNSGASGNITQAPEFVLGTICQDGTIGSSYPPAGWTNMTVGTTNSVSGYQIPTSSGSSFTYDVGTGNADWTAAIATIYAASSSGPSGTVQPRATVPVPRRQAARALWRGGQGQAFVAVPAPRQQYRTAPRRALARVLWRGGQGQAFVAVPAPRQQPAPAPRRKPARAYVRFTPVATVNNTATPSITGTIPALMANQTRTVVRRDGRVVRR